MSEAPTRAVFRDICACLIQFLKYEQFEVTLEAFISELQSRHVNSSPLLRLKCSSFNSQQEHAQLLKYFDQGNRESFLGLWQQFLPQLLQSDYIDKLEFQTQLYFAVFPALVGQSNGQALAHSLAAFKQYLDMSGSLLASDPQLLSYYALPYVKDPQSHPSFRHIFTPGFASDLRQQLSTALQTVPADQPLPRLYTMCAQAAHAASLQDTRPPGARQPTRQHPVSMDNSSAHSSLVGLQRGLSRPVSGQQGGKGVPVGKEASQGAGKGDSRPISALLNGSKELADLVSASKPRYADQLQGPSLEPSAEVLQVVHSEAPDGISAEPSYAEDAVYLPQSRLVTDPRVSAGSSITGSQLLPQALNTSVASAKGDRLTMHQSSFESTAFQRGLASVHSSSDPDAGVNDAATTGSTHTAHSDSNAVADGQARLPSSLQVNSGISSIGIRSLDAGQAEDTKIAVSATTEDTEAVSTTTGQQPLQGSTSSIGSKSRLANLLRKLSSKSQQQGGSAGAAYAEVTRPQGVMHTDSATANDLLDELLAEVAGDSPALQQSSVVDTADANTQHRSSSPSQASSRGSDGESDDGMQADAAVQGTALPNSTTESTGHASPACSPAPSASAQQAPTAQSPVQQDTDAMDVQRRAATLEAGSERASTQSDAKGSTSPMVSPVASAGRQEVDIANDGGTPPLGRSLSVLGRGMPAAQDVNAEGQSARTSLSVLALERDGGQSAGATQSLLSLGVAGQSVEASQSILGQEGSPSQSVGASQSVLNLEGDAGQSVAASQSSLGQEGSPGQSVGASQSLLGLEGDAGQSVGASLSLLGKEGGAGVIRHSVILASLDPLDQWLYTQSGMLPSLDFDKIKADLLSGEAGLAAAVLQSLRWRLDKAPSATDRCQVLASFAKHDVLMLRQAKEKSSDSLQSSSAASHSAAGMQWVRLVSVLAGMHSGRAYLCTATSAVVQQLCYWLQAQEDLTESNEVQSRGASLHALEALQRLSNRHGVRGILVDSGVVQWLARQLTHLEAVPEAAVECCGALLMNLALSKSGRQACQQVDMLTPLEGLLEHNFIKVQTYANAALYSLLREPAIRQTAREKGMDAFLQHIKEQADSVIARQIDCILQLWQQLDCGPDKDEAEEAGAGDDEVDDDPQDVHSHVGFGLEEAETIHSWDQLHGEKLLCAMYLRDRPSPEESPEQSSSPRVSLQVGESVTYMAAPAPSYSRSSSKGKRAVDDGKQTAVPAVVEMPVASSNVSRGLKPTAKLTKLISANKQEEYIAAFGSQTKLPRTPLLPGH